MGSSVSIPGTVPSVVGAEVSNQAMRHCLINAMIAWLITHDNPAKSLPKKRWSFTDLSSLRNFGSFPTRLPSGVRSDEVVVVCLRLISMSCPKIFLIFQCNCQNKRFAKLGDVDNSPIKIPCSQWNQNITNKSTDDALLRYFFFRNLPSCLLVGLQLPIKIHMEVSSWQHIAGLISWISPTRKIGKWYDQKCFTKILGFRHCSTRHFTLKYWSFGPVFQRPKWSV